ncbi:GNAT family N-acetyltransferase [Thermococcus thioreducens]|uniref:GNAT family N-acetyltransferase n=1 Tax=Thermococcus thioreducens TaxID=277988 RepID=UPI000AE624CE|nr:GNAT family N-acetyltransferase [Thermococcus thioreducens]
MRIKLLETDTELRKCLEIAKDLPEWFNEAGLRTMKRDLRSEKTFIAVNDREQEVLGFIILKPLNEKALEILWMAVRRELRGKGIGTKLLRFVENWAKGEGFELLVVKTRATSRISPTTRRGASTSGGASSG